MKIEIINLATKQKTFLECLTVTNNGNNYTFHIKEGFDIDYHLPQNHMIIKKENSINANTKFVDKFGSDYHNGDFLLIQISDE